MRSKYRLEVIKFSIVIGYGNVAGVEVRDVGDDVGVEVDLASVICSLRENRRLREDLGKSARHRVLSIYWGGHSRKNIRIYSDISVSDRHINLIRPLRLSWGSSQWSASFTKRYIKFNQYY